MTVSIIFPNPFKCAIAALQTTWKCLIRSELLSLDMLPQVPVHKCMEPRKQAERTGIPCTVMAL